MRPVAPGSSADAANALRRLGLVAAAFWSIHATNHVLRGSAHDLLWACNVAGPLLAAGCFFGAPRAIAVALSWLAFGTPVWLVDLATGAAMIPTSVFVHFGCLGVAVAAVRRAGWPRGSWIAATVASVVLLAITRLVAAAEPNVNLAFRVHAGWEKLFSSHLAYVAAMIAAAALTFLVVEKVALRVSSRAR